MKKTLVLVALVLSMLSTLAANDLPDPGRLQQTLDLPQGTAMSATRTPPNYTFSKLPTSILTSYYDYMIGSYNGLPLRVIPQSQGGGYFMTYHGRRTATGMRRVFHSHLDANGNLINNSEISVENINEGYPTLAVDPVSGKPFYAWHCNHDADTEFEDLLVSDAFLYGISGLFNDDVTIQNAPITITPSNAAASFDNEFIWPTAIIGPSPLAGKRRIYILMRNSVTHTYGPSENSYLRFADFNADDIELGTPLNWNTSNFTIPEMDDWNHDNEWRRPFHALVADGAGNIYFCGYHLAYQSDGSTAIDEPDMDVFKCTNYGQGTWTRTSAYSNLSSWNPPTSATDPTGYFKGDYGTPYADNELFWVLMNSSHLNATLDALGRIHVPGLWGFENIDHDYYPSLQFVKEFVFDPVSAQFTVNDVYPQVNPNNTHDNHYQPWDNAAPWGVVDSFGGNASTGFYPNMTTDWNFPYWDDTVHEDAMMFHYNNLKVTETNSEGMMAMVWENSWRAQQINSNANVDYLGYENTPEIFIAVSSDNGNSWSDPIKLNNHDTPQFTGLKPMWTYPADKVKFMGIQNGNKIGKLGLMFYNDYTWGANAISPPVHPTNDGGQVMFTELQIVFPGGNPPPQEPFGEPIVLSTSMTFMTGVMINGQMASSGDVLAAYVDVNGLPQLRGKGTIQVNNGIAGCLIQVYTEVNNESVYFKVWDASVDQVLITQESYPSEVNGSIGSWPDNLFWLHAGANSTQILNLLSGWNMMSLHVHPTNMNISSVFSGIMGSVVQIKSPEGVFIPDNPFSTLNALSDGKGYFVKLNNERSMVVTGQSINPSTPISLASGWNLVGFTPSTTMAVGTALSSIYDYLIQVKGMEGVYTPGNPYNTLTMLAPGRSYWMNLSQPAVLVYPSYAREEAIAQALPCLEPWGMPVFKTDSMAILCQLSEAAASGDYLAAFVNGELRGLSPIMNVENRLGSYLQVFTDIADEPINFMLIKQGTNTAMELSPALGSTPGSTIGDYSTGSYYKLSKDTPDTPAIPTALLNAYPNPFHDATSIRLNVEKDNTPIRLEIYNLKGQKVCTVYNGQLASGSQSIAWNGLNEDGQPVASGVYFCRMTGTGSPQSIKLMILK